MLSEAELKALVALAQSIGITEPHFPFMHQDFMPAGKAHLSFSEREYATQACAAATELAEEVMRLRARVRPPSISCKECNGSGREDNHVQGKTECGACDGTGVDIECALEDSACLREENEHLRAKAALADEIGERGRDTIAPSEYWADWQHRYEAIK